MLINAIVFSNSLHLKLSLRLQPILFHLVIINVYWKQIWIDFNELLWSGCRSTDAYISNAVLIFQSLDLFWFVSVAVFAVWFLRNGLNERLGIQYRRAFSPFQILFFDSLPLQRCQKGVNGSINWSIESLSKDYFILFRAMSSHDMENITSNRHTDSTYIPIDLQCFLLHQLVYHGWCVHVGWLIPRDKWSLIHHYLVAILQSHDQTFSSLFRQWTKKYCFASRSQ